MNGISNRQNKPSPKRECRSFVTGLALLLCLPLTAWSGGVVSTCNEASLRAAMNGGGLVTFNCDGLIALTNTLFITNDTTFEANGHQVRIGGNGKVRLFNVPTSVNLNLNGLMLTDGQSDMGGAISNAGTVRATDCRFSANLASNWLTLTYQGGAVYNAGWFTALRCTFAQNCAATPISQGPDAYSSAGGAIYNAGTLALAECSLVGNQALGWYGLNGYNAIGGGSGGPGRAGGSGLGGAIFNAGTASIVNSTIVSNRCIGGNGGWGGDGPYTMHNRDRIYYGPGGNGGNGGSALGGGIYSVGAPVNLTNCTVAFNSTSAGLGGYYGGGSPPGISGTNGVASGALHSSGSAALLNTLLAINAPTNATGSLADLGHNLSSDGSCDFANPGSMNNTDSKLGPLASNGGSTLTLALLPGSPAIDAGDNVSAPAVDQRGLARPFGLASDIGAYEYMPLLRISTTAQGDLTIQLFDGPTNQFCHLQTSTTLSNWQCVATNEISTNGTTAFEGSRDPGTAKQFYRVVFP